MKYFLAVLLSLISILCCAAIYIQTDKNGNTVFSDTPIGPDARIVVVPEVNQLSSPSAKAAPAGTPTTQSTTAIEETATESTTPQKTERKPYVQFDFTSPVDQETIQNQPTVKVTMQVAPPLQPGDTIQIYLDGNPWGISRPSTHFEFTAPYRGTHHLSAKIFDSDRNVLKQTNSITIFVFQAHIPTRNVPTNPF